MTTSPSWPHAQSGDGDAARQPVLITVEDENPNRAQILFCVGGARPVGLARGRAVVLGAGGDAVRRPRRSHAGLGARAAWKDAKEAGHDVTYWKESPSGKFEKQG